MSAEAFHTDYDRPPWIKVPLAKLTEYKPGRRTMAPAWWAVTEDGCVLFYKHFGSPQCNVDRAIVEKVRPELRVVRIDQAYVPDRYYPVDHLEWLPLSARSAAWKKAGEIEDRMPPRGCPECGWGKVAGCWRCGSR